jgi:hypothetical protein
LLKIPEAHSVATLLGVIDTDRRATEDQAVFNPHSKDQSMTPSANRPDTKAWRLQVWVSFGLAGLLCGIGLAHLPGADLDRAFMVMGYAFCLSTAFALAKFVRDNEARHTDTPLWGLVVCGGFALAMALTAWGLWRMQINPTYKAFLGVSWLFLISTVFTLAKTLRDAHEAASGAAACSERGGAADAGAVPVRHLGSP